MLSRKILWDRSNKKNPSCNSCWDGIKYKITGDIITFKIHPKSIIKETLLIRRVTRLINKITKCSYKNDIISYECLGNYKKDLILLNFIRLLWLGTTKSFGLDQIKFKEQLQKYKYFKDPLERLYYYQDNSIIDNYRIYGDHSNIRKNKVRRTTEDYHKWGDSGDKYLLISVFNEGKNKN